MSAFVLKIIACISMLIDHIGYNCNSMPMRAVGRIAFPVFAYLIYNGYRHTGNRLYYAARLAVCAVISQIPFSLFCTNSVTYSTGNVLVTLFVALLCLWCTDTLRRNRIGRWFCWLPMAAACALYQFGFLNSDYGGRGIVITMIFLFLDGKETWKRIVMTLLCLCAVFYDQAVNGVIYLIQGTDALSLHISTWEIMQLFSLLSLPFIFMYNDKKGPTPENPLLAKALQYAFYLFYPAHMLLIWLLRIL